MTMTEAWIHALRCPLCKGPMREENGSLRCEKRHCYDIARTGHINFVPNQKTNIYSKALFESRARVFEAGIFAPVVEAISQAVERYVREETAVLADAGCGEGYYTRAVCAGRPLQRMGFDLEKEAVKLAAKRDRQALFFVGDLANIPLADNSADVLLDIFTPANYAEFARVLKPGGILIKLGPRADYLCQLREAAADQLRHTDYTNASVEKHVQARMQVMEQRRITYTLPVDRELAGHLARMTPMLTGVDLDRVDLDRVKAITIDEEMYIGTIPKG